MIKPAGGEVLEDLMVACTKHLGLTPTKWEFPKIGDLNIVP